MISRKTLIILGLVLAGSAATVYARNPARAGKQLFDLNVSEESLQEEGIDVTAERLEYEAERDLLMASGNVVIRQGEVELRADSVTVHTGTQEAYASGNVHLDQAGSTWEGDELIYNFQTGQGDFGEFEAYVSPYYISAVDSKRVTEKDYLIVRPRITTCEGDNPAFYMSAQEATVEEGHIFRARHVTAWLGPIPVFYMPYWKYDTDKHSGWEFIPGYASRWGAYLLSTYHAPLGRYVESATRIDVRTRRGLALGQDFFWEDPDHRDWGGSIEAYYIRDEDRFLGAKDDEEEQEWRATDRVPRDRYRFRLYHWQNLTERDRLLVDMGYVSDPEVLDDFFYRKYRHGAEPNTVASVTHRGKRYTASILVNKRLNDFYEHVDRLPQLALDIRRQRIARTHFFYESKNQAAYLEKYYEDKAVSAYDSFRADTYHKVLYVRKYFGWLNSTPYAAYRGTYYGHKRDGDPGYRNLGTFGLNNSFKAFKAYIRPRGDQGGLRHMIMPYANYVYQPEPNLTPDELLQFDSIDELDKEHRIKLGMRNKLQTKRNGQVWDFIDIDTYTYYRVEPEEYEEDFSDFYYEARTKPFDWMAWDFDGQYDWYGNRTEEFNTQLAILARDKSSLGCEYRYERDERDQFQIEVNLFPEDKWSFLSYWRFDFDEHDLAEQVYEVGHKFDCLGLSVGYQQKDSDDWNVMMKVWLLAFPSAKIGAQAGAYDF